MTTNWSNDDEDIVLDEVPREDGLPCPAEAEAQQPAGAAVESHAWRQVADTLPEILQRLNALDASAWATEIAQRLPTSDDLGRLTERLDRLVDQVMQLEKRLDEQAESSPADTPQPSTPTPPELDQVFAAATTEAAATTGQSDEDFMQLLYGSELCGDASLQPQLARLLEQAFDRQPKAIGLAARLMLVQSVQAEELPSLLKELGEAYYSWEPKTQDTEAPFETALVRMLGNRIAAVGLRNSIDLVRLGDRYDATRHISPARGVQVTEIRGWVVLRENGKPLTKALVGLR